MKYDYIIIGQGIAGTLLSFKLLQRGCSVLVFDADNHHKASLVSGAVINPVNVNKGNQVENAQLIVSSARNAYQGIEKFLDLPIYQETSLFVFDKHLPENEFIHTAPAGIDFDHYFNYEHTVTKVSPVININAPLLLTQWREYLLSAEILQQCKFIYEDLELIHDAVRYHSFTAGKIICCEGAAAIHNPFLNRLPFVRNRGEALIIETSAALPEGLFHHGHIRLIPIADNRYWCGSNYQWQFNDLQPDINWKNQTVKHLQEWLKTPFRVIDHQVAKRPTTAGQKTLTGFLNDNPQIGFLNGLGTRGFSLAPLMIDGLISKM